MHTCSVESNSFASPWTITCQASLSTRFPRQEYLSELPFSPPGDLPHPWIKPASPALRVDSLPYEPPAQKALLFFWKEKKLKRKRNPQNGYYNECRRNTVSYLERKVVKKFVCLSFQVFNRLGYVSSFHLHFHISAFEAVYS